MEINQIIIHHSGSLKGQPYASTAHITPQQISRYHKSRWNFPSKYIKDESRRYMGYNVVYDPKTRQFTQGRVIGEETAHTIGYNRSSFGLCIIGNYNNRSLGSPRGTVDELTEQTVKDVTRFLYNLITGDTLTYNNVRTTWVNNLVVAPNTELNFSSQRVHSHSFFSNTECYGTGIDKNLFRNRLIEYEKKNVIFNFIKAFCFDVLDEVQKKAVRKAILGTKDSRECPGIVEVTN